MARKKQLNSEIAESSTAPTTSKTTTTKTTTRKKQQAAEPKAASSSESKTARKPLARRTSKASAQAEQRLTEVQAQPEQPVAASEARVRAIANAAPATPALPWRRIDLHLHTPGSGDYEQPDKTYLDILKQAEKRGLSAIAFTDHNTVNGYRQMMSEIEHLEYLERLGRIHADELWRLNEYRRLMQKILVMPGFEFTATFGFHILGIFPPEKSMRDIERVLMDLRVPGPVLDHGLTEAGATSDVLAAYEAIDEAGGIAIAAHANSSNGVSMRGMNLGGQTRIAFTQDPHLYAIEFTDLEKGRHSSAHLFTGIKPEYPRRMHAIQGSDAHRLAVSKENTKRLGVGERPTEVQLERVTFESLKELFRSQDWHRVRPAFTVADVPDDALATARQTGASATAAFHPALPKRGDRFEAVLRDIAAMANGEGGSIFIGCDADTKKIAGVADAQEVTSALSEEVAKRIAPHLAPHIGLNDADGAKVVVIRVPAGTDAPYLFDNAHFLVREGTEARAATRDEIVAIARRGYEKPRPQQAQQNGQQQRPAQDPRQDQRRQPNQDNRQRNDPRAPRQDARSYRDPRDNRRQNAIQPNDRRGNQERPQQNQRGPAPVQQPFNPVDGNGANAFDGVEDNTLNIGTSISDVRDVMAMPTQLDAESTPQTSTAPTSAPAQPSNGANTNGNRGNSAPADPPLPGMPRTGVQVTTMDNRNGIEYFTVRDLRNNSMIRNVTRKSARDLWHYAVTQHADHAGGYDPSIIDWHGENNERSVLSREMRAGKMRSDLAMLGEDSRVQVFYGVTDDGIDAEWKTLIADYEAARAVNVADEPVVEAAAAVIDDDGFIDEPQPTMPSTSQPRPKPQNRRRRGGRAPSGNSR